jgi:transcriptional regulator GlxA family with amidase domain
MKRFSISIAAALAFWLAMPLTVIATTDPAPPATTAPGMGADPKGKIYILDVVVSEKGILLDFAGAAEVFREVAGVPFAIHYVASTLDPVTLKGGMKIIPTYTFDTAPRPDYVLIGSQGTEKAPDRIVQWLKTLHTDQTTLVSVCTGSDWLAQAGLLDNKEATTHHLVFGRFQQKYSSVKLVEGKRYVQSDPYIFTGAGFSSGMDLALHIVDVRFGRDVAKRTADRLEYRGDGWITNQNAYPENAGK